MTMVPHRVRWYESLKDVRPNARKFCKRRTARHARRAATAVIAAGLQELEEPARDGLSPAAIREIEEVLGYAAANDGQVRASLRRLLRPPSVGRPLEKFLLRTAS